MQKVLIDCDPGHDDATAILYAATHLDLVGITTVYGNQTVDKTTANALSLVTLLGLDVPVARGCGNPLVGKVRHGGDVHGKTGIDGTELPVPDREEVDVHAVDFIIEMASRYRNELVLCPIGPMTNVGIALRKEPRLAKWLRGISMMCGTTQVGNVTPVAEFNIWCDPEAADIVFRSCVPLWMAGLNVTRQAGISDTDIARIAGTGRVGDTFAGLLSFFLNRLREVHGLSTASLHDPCALVPFICPEVMTYRHTSVEIALAQGPTRGMTVCDFRHLTPAPLENIEAKKALSCHVGIEIDGPALVEHIVSAIIAWPDRPALPVA